MNRQVLHGITLTAKGLILPFLQETFQQEGEEIGESIELAVPTNVLVAKFDAVFYIWIGIPLDLNILARVWLHYPTGTG